MWLRVYFSWTGVKWIKQKYGDELRIIRIGQKGYLETIEMALTQGLFPLNFEMSFFILIVFIFQTMCRQNSVD